MNIADIRLWHGVRATALRAAAHSSRHHPDAGLSPNNRHYHEQRAQALEKEAQFHAECFDTLKEKV